MKQLDSRMASCCQSRGRSRRPRKSRQILIPRGVAKSEVRPTRIERRARLVNAIARGRRWLDEIVSGSVTDVAADRGTSKMQRASGQHDDLARVPRAGSRQAAVEGRLPRGVGVERLRDAPAEWSQQFEALGLNPHNYGPDSKRRFGLHTPKFPAADRDWPSKTLPRGTEFLDAETGGQNSARETASVCRDRKSGTIPAKIPAETAYFRSKTGFRRFGTTGWWCAQSSANRSLTRLRELTGQIRESEPIS